MSRVTLQWTPPWSVDGSRIGVDELLEGVKADFIKTEWFLTPRLEETVEVILRYVERIVWGRHLVELALRDGELDAYPALREWTGT